MSKIPCERCLSPDRANCNCGWTSDPNLTFSAAMALDPSEVEASWGTVWLTLYACADSHTLADFRTAKFRRARPRKSRVQEMATSNLGPDIIGSDRLRWAAGAEWAIRAVCEYLRNEGAYYSSDKVTAERVNRHFLEPR